MDYLIGNLKDNGESSEIRSIIDSDNCLYDMSQIDSTSTFTEFNNDHKLDSDEMYKVSNFKKSAYDSPMISNGIVNPSQCVQLKNKEISKIKYICDITDGYLLFQRTTRGKILKRRGILRFAEMEIVDVAKNVAVEILAHPNNSTNNTKDPLLLILNQYPDAYYNIEKDELYFKELRPLKRIFKDIGNLYRKATQQEVDDFVTANKFIELGDRYDTYQIGENNRRQITSARAILKGLKPPDKKELLTYAGNHVKNMFGATLNNGIFTITSEKQLKMFLYALDERFYETTVTKKMRLADSITPF